MHPVKHHYMGRHRKKVKRSPAEQKKDFYQHLSTYLIMGTFFFVFNALTSWGAWWFYWPMLGWGIGVAFHFMDTFGAKGVAQLFDFLGLPEFGLEEDNQEQQRPASTGRQAEEDEEELELRPLQREATRKWDEEDLV